MGYDFMHLLIAVAIWGLLMVAGGGSGQYWDGGSGWHWDDGRDDADDADDAGGGDWWDGLDLGGFDLG